MTAPTVSDAAVQRATDALVAEWRVDRHPTATDAALAMARAALAAAAPLIVADAVAAERERIATAIEAETHGHRDEPGAGGGSKQCVGCQMLHTAARIARTDPEEG